MKTFEECVIALARTIGFEVEGGPKAFDVYHTPRPAGRRRRAIRGVARQTVLQWLLAQKPVQELLYTKLMEGSEDRLRAKLLLEERDTLQQSIAALSIGRRMMLMAGKELDEWLDKRCEKPELTRALTGAQAYARGLPKRSRMFTTCKKCDGHGFLTSAGDKPTVSPADRRTCQACHGQGSVEKKGVRG